MLGGIRQSQSADSHLDLEAFEKDMRDRLGAGVERVLDFKRLCLVHERVSSSTLAYMAEWQEGLLGPGK